MSRTVRSLVAATGVAAIAIAGLAAAPVNDTATVTADGDTISVAGTLAEELAAIAVGTDEVGDAVGSGYGWDLAAWSVSFPEAGKVSFHVEIGDANAATGHAPQGLAIEITPTIGATAMELTATATLDGGLEFGQQSCTVNPDTGVNECGTTPVDGSFADGVLTWTIDTTAAPGDTVNPGVAHSNFHVGTGVQGGVTFVNGIIDDMGISAFAGIPGARLLIDGEVVTTGALANDGYAVSASGIAPGEHTVAVELCGGDVEFNGGFKDCTIVDLGTVTVDAA